MSRFPVAFRLPAFASRSSDSRRGIGPSSRSAYRGETSRPDLDGVTAFRTRELRPGWVPSLPRGRWCSPGQVVSLTGTCRSAAASPYSPPAQPIERGPLHEASTTAATLSSPKAPSAWRSRRRPTDLAPGGAAPRSTHPAARPHTARPRQKPARATARPPKREPESRDTYDRNGRVGRTPCGVRPPSEPGVPVSEHPAQASPLGS